MSSRKGMFKVLDRADIEAIHGATIKVLAETGVYINSQETLDLLAAKGLEVNRSTKVVKMSESSIAEATKSCKRNFKWAARSKKNDVEAVDGRTKIGPGAQCLGYLDPDTNRIRRPTLDDAILCCKLLDALPNASIGYVPVHIGDVPEALNSVVQMCAGLIHSSKCTFGGSADAADVELTMRIADAILGDRNKLRKRPLFAGYVDPISPLAHDRTMLEVLLGYCRMDLPVFVTVMAMAGGTAPASLAGLLVQQNAEILSSVVIASCVTKAPKIVYGSVSCPLDMRHGTAATGSPESSLLGLGAIQMAKYYKLPSNMGVQSDSKTSDEQTTYEKSFAALTAIAGGADFSDLFFGSTNAFEIFSPVQAVIDDEIAANAMRIAEGVVVNDETLSVEVMAKVGPMGSYLKNRDTLRRFRKEHHAPVLTDRLPTGKWQENGSKDARTRAKNRLVEILNSHVPEPLDSDVRMNIDSLLREHSKSLSVEFLERKIVPRSTS